jgi:GT2 family glycosyltransferase
MRSPERSLRLGVGITTRNRPEALARCLQSLALIAHLHPRVAIFDDASAPSVRDSLRTSGLLRNAQVIRDERGPGLIVGRNVLVRMLDADAVLLLDDDAALLDATAVERALDTLRHDPQVIAVAFAQADGNGVRCPVTLQPAASATTSYVASFIGFAHMIRREAFLALGGYRERFVICGEEKDFCLRALNAGYSVVYLPDAEVAHSADPSGRDLRRYLRYVTRNDCLYSLLNEPWIRLWWTLPARFARYFIMRRRMAIDDPGGGWWLARELSHSLSYVRRERRAVSRQTLAQWHARRAGVPYPS